MWYYTKDGQQAGPVDDAALDQLIASRTVTAETYLWKEGQADWLPLAQVRPSAAPSSGLVPLPTAVCDKCGKTVGADSLVDLLGVRVCADCKPLVLQSIQEGASPTALSSATAWAEGKNVVTVSKNVLPHRCYKCNAEPEGEPVKRKFYWHPPFYYIVVLISPIIYVIVAMIVRKTAAADLFLCAAHKKKRKTFMMIGWGGFLFSIILFITGAAANMGWLCAVSFLVFLGSVIGGLIGGSLATSTRIDGETVWLSGAGKEFLASLPQWPSSKK